jgi:mutator protein MutT
MSEPQVTSETGTRTEVVIAIIRRENKVLICQRPAGKSFERYWEFPGGKRETGETVMECLEREVWEELAVRVRPRLALSIIDHDYPRGRIRLHPYVCDHVDGDPQPLASQAVKWVDPRDLMEHQFPPANDKLLEEVIRMLDADTR